MTGRRSELKKVFNRTAGLLVTDDRNIFRSNAIQGIGYLGGGRPAFSGRHWVSPGPVA